MKENTEISAACNHNKVSFWGLLITLGIVFGDIGTSPLYVMKAVLHTGETIDQRTILGALSCIIWTLTLQTTIKYVCVALRADNNGEGGILALYALLRRLKSKWIYILAIIGASTLLADGIITPAITVTTAIEGLESISPPSACHSHHACHHNHHLLRPTLWHREHRQVVWSIHAAMVPAVGHSGNHQYHILSSDTEGLQSLLCCLATGKIPTMVFNPRCCISLHHRCRGFVF